MTHNRRTSDAELVPNGSPSPDVARAAAHLRIDRATVYRLLQRRELPIPILRLGAAHEFVPTDVEKYLAMDSWLAKKKAGMASHRDRGITIRFSRCGPLHWVDNRKLLAARYMHG